MVERCIHYEPTPLTPSDIVLKQAFESFLEEMKLRVLEIPDGAITPATNEICGKLSNEVMHKRIILPHVLSCITKDNFKLPISVAAQSFHDAHALRCTYLMEHPDDDCTTTAMSLSNPIHMNTQILPFMLLSVCKFIDMLQIDAKGLKRDIFELGTHPRSFFKLFNKWLPCKCMNIPTDWMRENIPKIKLCEHCGRRGTDLKTCSRCKTVVYCNADHQKADWKRHKEICNGLHNAMS